MADTTPTWQVTITHGLGPGVQLRAALLLLALSKRRATYVRPVALGGAWCRLLSLDEQANLYWLYIQKAPKGSLGASLVHKDQQPRQLMLTDAPHVHAGLHPDAWLGLIGADVPVASILSAGQWQLGAGTEASLLSGPQAAAPWLLPWPVHDLFMEARGFAAGHARGSGLLWIAGPHPPEQAIERLQALCDRFGPGVQVFDPYDLLSLPEFRSMLPTGVRVAGLTCARGRRDLYDGCGTFVVDAPGGGAPDAFALEAVARGLVPWDEATRAAHDMPAGAIVGMSAFIDGLLPVMEGHGKAAAPSLVSAHGFDITLCSELAQTQANTVQKAGPPRGLLLAGPLPQGSERAALVRAIAAGAYQCIATQIGPHTTFLLDLMVALMGRPVAFVHDENPQSLWQQATAWLSAQVPGAVLHVLVPSRDAKQTEAMQQLLQRWAQPDGHTQSQRPVPVIAINAEADFRLAGASDTHVGSAVASHDIAWGVAQGLSGLARTPWLRQAGAEYDTASTFMHPLTRQQDATRQATASDLWSAATLRLALAHSAVDGIFMPGGPLGSAVQAMRCSFAQQPVALVSVLHGMHAPRMQQDIAAYLLNGPVYPFDGFVSPSICGRAVFEHLWEGLRQWLLRQGHRHVPEPVDIAVIPYGVDTAFYAPRPRLACRQNLALPPHDVTILSLGRISRRFKTCLLPLLLALQQLQRSGLRPKLVIAGALMAPKERDRLESTAAQLQLQDQVHFRTSLSLEDKAQILSAADIFVALSDSCQETHGLAPIEAMAAGLPVVAAAWNGYRELVLHGETGFLIPTAWTDIPEALYMDNAIDKQLRDLGFDDLHETVATDVGALTQALASLCRDKELRAGMGARGRARAQSHFDARVQGAKLAQHVLSKTREAAAYQARFKGPERYMLVDRVDARFKHYATDWLTESTLVRLGPEAKDPVYRRAVLAYIGAQDGAEAAIVDEIVERVADDTVALSALLGPRVDMLRLMRCLKYNILQRA